MTLQIKPLRVPTIKNLSMACLTIAAFFAPIGATGFSINVGIGEFSLFRIFLLLALLFRIFQNGIGDNIVRLCNRYNKFSIGFFTLWVVYAAMTLIWSRDISNYVRILFFLGSGFLIVLLVSDACTFRDLNKLLKAFNYGLLIQAVMGFYEFITGKWLFLKQVSVDIYLSRNLHYPVAMMGNPNDFATGMFLGIVISLFFFNSEVITKRRKYLYLALIMFYFMMIFVSNSRASLIGALMCSAFVFYKKRDASSKVLLIVLVVMILMAPGIMNFIMSHIDLEYFRTEGESFSNRVNLIRNGFNFLFRTFGFGVGNGQIEYWMRNNAVYATGNIENMHNWWMELLTAYGIPVFVGYMVFYINLYKCFLNRYLNNKNMMYSKQYLVLAAALLGLVMTLISSSSNMTKEYMWLFWAICVAFQRNLHLYPEIEEVIGEV